MTEVCSIACGLPFCQDAQGQQTNLSIGLRIAAIVSGTLASVAAALILFNIPGLSQFGTTPGWTLVSIGALLLIVGTSIKCIKRESPIQTNQTKESRTQQTQEQKAPKNTTRFAATGTSTIEREKIEGITRDTNLQTIDVSESSVVAKTSLESLKYISHMAAMPVEIHEYRQTKFRFMQLRVFLDDILSNKEPDYLGYVDTLIACMQKLQNFDQNLVFGVTFCFQDESVSLEGHEIKFQEVAKLVFCNLVEKYISGRMPQDGSPKLNLLLVGYSHIPLQNIAEEWVKRAIPLISLNNIVSQLGSENTAEAEKKLNEFKTKCVLYDLLVEKELYMVPCSSTPLEFIMERLNLYDQKKT